MRVFLSKQLNRNNGLLKHSGIMFLAAFISSFLNYLFQLYMGRQLGPVDYGILGSLFSLFYIISAPVTTITTVVTNYVAGYWAKKDLGSVHSLFMQLLKYLSILGFSVFLSFTLFSGVIRDYLHIPSTVPIILIGIVAWFSFIEPLFRGVLNGFQRFTLLGLSMNFGAFTKFLFGVLLVSIGFGVNGAVTSLILSSVFVILFIFFPIRHIFQYKRKPVDLADISKYSVPVLFLVIVVTLIMNVDVILVKHYFHPIHAGYFAAASVLAKLIFFSSSTLVQVIFPKVTDLDKKGINPGPILKSTLLYIAGISVVILTPYFIIPQFVVNLLYGSEYQISQYIGLYGFAIALFSMSNIVVMYNIALRRFKLIVILVVCLVLEVAAVALFHSSIYEVIKILIMVNLLLLFSLLAYTLRE